MNRYDLDWHAYRFLPYERRLALREVEALAGAGRALITDDGVTLQGRSIDEERLRRLTYVRQVRFNGSGVLVPQQAQLEASGARHAPSTSRDLKAFPKRQSTRYSVHGLHEYKGKFNPQIVRAAANVLGVGVKGTPRLFDPFCGSGTSLVEAAHMGWDAMGFDANPLAVFISNAKLRALRVPVSVLKECLDRLGSRLLPLVSHIDCSYGFDDLALQRFERLTSPLANEDYLRKWFARSVIAQLRLIVEELKKVEYARFRQIALVVLSDILRPVSMQDPADLRIRRRSDPKPNYPVIQIYVDLLEQKLATVIKAREVLGRVRGRQRAQLSDSRVCSEKGAFDAVITSPPYATALPYIDTQRLSLALLGLLEPGQLAKQERQLIGNREISTKEKKAEERALFESAHGLPSEVLTLCRTASELACGRNDGFRRRNMPALLFRYFRDMQGVFSAVRLSARRGAGLAMIVGPNRTTLGGQEISIDTPRLLATVAESVGWRVEELIALDAYQRFELHQQNSIRSEQMLILRSR